MITVCISDNSLDRHRIQVQGCIPIRGTSPDILAGMLFEVASEADSLEDDLFGSDED